MTGSRVPGRRVSRRHWTLCLVAVAFFFMGCETEDSAESGNSSPTVRAAPDTMTIDRILRTDSRFSTLRSGLDSTGLDSVLAARGPYTLFAPPDSAFQALPEGTISVLLTERVPRLRTILSHHMVEGRVELTTLADSTTLTSLSGDTLRVRDTDSTIVVENANVLEDGVEGANGLIYVIDRVLRPPEEE